MCVAMSGGFAAEAALTMASAARTWPAPAIRTAPAGGAGSEILRVPGHACGVQRLDLRQVDGHVARGHERRHDPDQPVRVVESDGNDRDVRFRGDVIEAELPLLHLAASSFRSDGDGHLVAAREFRNAGADYVSTLGTVDGHATESARQDAERPEEHRVLGQPG